MSSRAYEQLEIWWVDLEPTKGHETQKKRPCIIIQSTFVNKGSKTVIVAPLLPGHKDWPFAVKIQPSAQNGLDKSRHLNLKQLRAVDILRVDTMQGKLENTYKPQINAALSLVFDMGPPSA
jgi:mRNA interferase MazF